MISDWTGSYPQKFGKTKKHINITYTAQSSRQGLYGDVDTGIDIMKGRKHYESGACEKQYEWKPCFKKVAQETMPIRPVGLRNLTPKFQEPKPRAERKHVTPSRATMVKDLFNDSCEVKYTGNYMINNRIW